MILYHNITRDVDLLWVTDSQMPDRGTREKLTLLRYLMISVYLTDNRGQLGPTQCSIFGTSRGLKSSAPIEIPLAHHRWVKMKMGGLKDDHVSLCEGYFHDAYILLHDPSCRLRVATCYNNL